jgi:hypothetical protein
VADPLARALLNMGLPTSRSRRTHHMSTKPFESIDPAQLATVAGGASRVSAKSGGNDQLTAMLTQITSSIKDLASSQSSGMDPMMMMVMMMMMGGGGGGGAGYAAGAGVTTAHSPQTVNVDAQVAGGGCGRGKGKKGW